jgi:simple sugar transport system permease protein
MSAFLFILESSSPLLLASFGGLVSEYAGRMALFLDGVINLSAFLCFAFTLLTDSLPAGILLAVFSSVLLIIAADSVARKLHADPFLTSLALNLFCSALATALSASFFGTQGILTAQKFSFPPEIVRKYSTAGALLLFGAGWAFLKWTKTGLYLRITGSDADVLEARGVSADFCRTLSWGIAAFYAACAGCILSLSLSSYVPNISSGRGWTALAAVFLGKKNAAAVGAAAILFSAAGYAASNIQNITHVIPSSVLISLPYFIALLLIFVLPGQRGHQQ